MNCDDGMAALTERLQRELAALPVAALVKPLNETLRRETAAIVTAAPGAGKSTVLPLTILEGLRENTGKIVVLEPRRVAARQIASRMAWLLGESVGETVGYRIRAATDHYGRTAGRLRQDCRVGAKTCGGTANRLTYGMASWRAGWRDRGLPHPVRE